MRKLSIVLLLTLLLISCQQENVLRIGVVGSMSGSQSELSVSGRRGVELAVLKINENGGLLGKKVELVVKDDYNDSKRSKEIVKEFLDDDIEIVIGPFTSGMMLAAYDTIKANEVLYVSPTVSDDSLNGKDDNIIRLIASTREQAVILNKVASKNIDKNFIVVADNTNSGYYQMMSQNFKEILEDNQGIVLDFIDYSELDASAIDLIESSCQNSQVDGILIISNAGDFALIAQNLRNKNIDISLYGTLWSHTNDLIRLGGNDIEHAFIVSGISQNRDYHEFNKISMEYYDRYGEEISFSSLYSYETMMAINKAIIEGESSRFEDVKSALLDIRHYEGLQFKFTLNEYGDSSRPYKIDQIIDGGFFTIEE